MYLLLMAYTLHRLFDMYFDSILLIPSFSPTPDVFEIARNMKCYTISETKIVLKMLLMRDKIPIQHYTLDSMQIKIVLVH